MAIKSLHTVGGGLNRLAQRLYLLNLFSRLQQDYAWSRFTLFALSVIQIFNDIDIAERLVAAYIAGIKRGTLNGVAGLYGSNPEGGVLDLPPPASTTWVGVPDPDFGATIGNPITATNPTLPDPWDGENTGYYYIDEATGTDSGRTYGYPAAPRATIPDPLPAGSVVVVKGDYSYTSVGYTRFNSQGTSTNPVWILSDETTQANFTNEILFYGSYLLIDGIKMFRAGPRLSTSVAEYMMFRNFECTGHTGGLGVNSTLATNIHNNIVFYNGSVHDTYNDWANSYDPQAGDGPDNHGFAFGANLNNIWVLDVSIYNIAGNCLQLTGSSAEADWENQHHFYIGGCTMTDSLQSAIGLKNVNHVVFSGNHIYDILVANTNATSAHAAATMQYANDNIWFINNHVHDCDTGFRMQSGSPYSTSPSHRYIGNLIYNITYDGTMTQAWSDGFAIREIGGTDVVLLNNTIYNVDACFGELPITTIAMEIENNIFHTNNDAFCLRFDSTTAAGNANIRNNVFYNTTVACNVAGTDYATVANMEAALSGASNNLSADPDITLPGTTWTLQTGSNSIGSGLGDSSLSTDLYAEFLSVFGLDIHTNIDGSARSSTAPDIGAYPEAA